MSIDTKILELLVTIIGLIIIPLLGWFATYTTGRLKSLEQLIDNLREAKSTMVTREEFNGRMDALTSLILHNLHPSRKD